MNHPPGRLKGDVPWAALVFFLTAHLAMIVASACRDADVITASYSTIEEARKAGAIDRGWLPVGLPTGAYDIREAHDPKSRRRWALFSFPVTESATLQRLLDPNETSLAGQVCDAPGRIEWWPVLLRGKLDPERLGAAGLHAYRSRDGILLFAVNWNQGRAYYWTPPLGGRP